MAALRGQHGVSVRLSRCPQINRGALHGPRLLEISHRAMVMSTQRHLSDVISETLSLVQASSTLATMLKTRITINNAFVMLKHQFTRF